MSFQVLLMDRFNRLKVYFSDFALFLLSIGIAALSLIFNPSLLLFGSSGLIASIVGFIKPRIGLYSFLVFMIMADFAKRALLINVPVSDFEWNLVIFIPDLILLSSVVGTLVWILLTNKKIRLMNIDLVVISFFIWELFAAFNPKNSIVIGLAGFKLSGLYILVYFLARLLINNPKQFHNILKLTLVTAVITALYGIFQVLFGLSSFEKIWFYEGYTTLHEGNLFLYGILRPFSTFSDPGSFSQYLAIAIIMSFALIQRTKNFSTRLIIFIADSFLGIVLILTVVRAGWIVLLAGSITLIMYKFRSLRRFIPLLVILTLLAIPLIGKSIQQTNIIYSIQSPFVRRALTTGTLFDRIQGWQNFLNNQSFRPIFGNGLGTIGVAPQKLGGSTTDLPHNQFLTIIYETGWVGIFLFLLIIFIYYRSIQNNYALRLGSSAKSDISVSVAVITGLLVMGASVSEFLFLRTSATYFWLTIGILPQATSWVVDINREKL